MRLIGLTGKMGSGKSTALEQLKDQTPVLVKFAQPLYDMQDYVYDKITPVYKKPEGFIKDRKLLQFLGTDWGRSLDTDIWLKLWESRVNNAHKHLPEALIIADDLRFDNEAEIVLKMGGKVIEIVSSRTQERDVAGSNLTAHASELGIAKHLISGTVVNDGSIEELKLALLKVL